MTTVEFLGHVGGNFGNRKWNSVEILKLIGIDGSGMAVTYVFLPMVIPLHLITLCVYNNVVSFILKCDFFSALYS